jgi:hypothetical protein
VAHGQSQAAAKHTHPVLGAGEAARAAGQSQQQQHEVGDLRVKGGEVLRRQRGWNHLRGVVEQRHAAQAQQQHTNLRVDALERADLCHRLLHLELHEFCVKVIVANGMGASATLVPCGDLQPEKQLGAFA